MAILFVRHGPTAFNHEQSGHDRIRGWLNLPLTPEGVQVAHRAAQALHGMPMQHLYSSDLDRAAHTARIIGGANGIGVTTHPELRPWNLGDLTGQPSDKVLPIIEKLVDKPGAKAPNGESFNDFIRRYIPFIMPLLESPGLFGAVTHIRNIKAIEALIAGKGELHKETWKKVPQVVPGGAVLATPNSFKVLPDGQKPETEPSKGAGS